MAPQAMVIVAGNARHGKDTLSDLLAEMIPSSRRDAYANPMKEAVHIKTGIPMDILNGPTGVKDNPEFGRYGLSPRDLTILEGKNGRDIDENFWTDSLLGRFERSQEKVTIVSDCRFPLVEGVQIREKLGKAVETILVLVRRPDVPVKRGDVTEDLIADADPTLFDYTVMNTGTLEDLVAVARQLADAVVIRAKLGNKRLRGWSIKCVCGSRIHEPMLNEGDALMVALNRMVPCSICGSTEDAQVDPCRFDLLDVS